MTTKSNARVQSMKKLSPRRNSTQATSLDELVLEQMVHFGIEPSSEYGECLSQITRRMYESYDDLDHLWRITLKSMGELDSADRIKYFNAKKFLAFQLAKLLDNFQNTFRRSYQSLGFAQATASAKGPYPVFDNVTAIFSATPVISRTATYIYACAEWIEDAFKGEELMLEIYSRLLNPTSVCLANHIVDLECGPYADQYFAWNYNSGMAAIDATLSHVLGRDDILITSRNIYGGAHQLIHDWFGKPGNLDIAVETFDGYDAQAFLKCLSAARTKHADRLNQGRQIYVYLESPCNPHGYILDVPEICKVAHAEGLRVMLDATVGTPFLLKPLQQIDEQERPDFVIHSYTKDISGLGSVIAGCVIGRNIDMFIPKGQTVSGRSWEETMFWNVYYVKGAFLNADAAFEVIQGARTLSLRMMQKCINTQILAEFLAAHPRINVNCNAIQTDANSSFREKLMYLGLPAPLFTIDLGQIPREHFQRFFDALSPTFGHMISLGQSNTIVSCPALTTHSELNVAALAAGGLTPTTIRIAVGDEDPMDLLAHLVYAAQGTIDQVIPEFSQGFMSLAETKALIERINMRFHLAAVQQANESTQHHW